jgi:hypothetical protein
MRIHAWMIVAAIVLAHRPASADCSNGATSEGYDQCQKYPGCTCSYEVKSCANGGWYWLYNVTEPCAAGSPKPTKPDGSPAPTTPPSDECLAMQRWDAERHMLLQKYMDPQLVQMGDQLGWSSYEYHMAIWHLQHWGETPPPGGLAGAANMYTQWFDPDTHQRVCTIQKIDEGCADLARRGLPKDACSIAQAHEQVHVQQCQSKSPTPTTPSLASQDEIPAYQKEISEIEQWIHDHC